MKMLKHILTIAYLFGAFCNAVGQNFEVKQTEIEGLRNAKMSTFDMNADEQMDLLIVGFDKNGLLQARVYSIDQNGVWELIPANLPAFTDQKFILSDMNQDWYNDLIYTGISDGGSALKIAYNNGEFEFIQRDSTTLDGPTIFEVGDFSQNGKLDVIMANDSSTKIWYQLEDGFQLGPTVDMSGILEIETLDIDNDNDTDLLVTREVPGGQNEIYIVENDSVFIRREDSLGPVEQAVFSKGDFNGDGWMDFAVGGIFAGENQFRVYQNENGDFNNVFTYVTDNNISDIIAIDLTNNGKLDVILALDSAILLLENDSDKFNPMVLLDSISENAIAVGDFDGDLDQDLFISGTKNGSIRIYTVLNKNEKNTTPTGDGNDFYVLQTSQGTILKWSPFIDDKTSTSSLSYRVLFGRETDIVASLNWTLPEYGVQELGTEYLFKDLKAGRYSARIFAQDNSFVMNYFVCKNSGIGPSSTGTACTFMIEEFVEPMYGCVGEELEFTIQPGLVVDWLSLSRGYLEQSDTLHYEVLEEDVIYTRYTGTDGCYLYWSKEILLKEKEFIEANFQDIVVCEGDSILLEYLDHDVTWIREGFEPDSTQQYLWVADESSSLYISIDDICFYPFRDTIEMVVNPIPKLEVTPDFEMFVGESAQLTATGAEKYSWSPDTWLSDANLSNPVCAPLNEGEIVYEVTGFSLENCSSTQSVRVNVLEKSTTQPGQSNSNSLFVPNIISPIDPDPKNQAFIVQGYGIQSLTLRIMSASGGLMYESSDIVHIQNEGWDGTKNGKKMPAGVYVWMIAGEFSDGTKVNYQGRNTGAFTLIR